MILANGEYNNRYLLLAFFSLFFNIIQVKNYRSGPHVHAFTYLFIFGGPGIFLNSGFSACCASTLPFEPCSQLFLL
jgi:hypothetical protein